MRDTSNRAFVLCALVVLGIFVPLLRSAPVELPFTAALAAGDQTAAGLSKLTESERAELDRQIAREITLARQGDVVAFAKTFSERRSTTQLTATGLERLSATERTQLDGLIARAVARRPAPIATRYAKKAEEDGVETVTYRPQLYGEVSLTYGTAGHGREFYGGSFTTVLEDPAHRLTVAFTYAEYHGKGLFPFDDYCGPLSRNRLGFRPEE